MSSTSNSILKEEVLWKEISILRKKEENGKAEESLEELLVLYPRSPEVVHQLLQVRFLLGKETVENLLLRSEEFPAFLPLQRDIVAMLLEFGESERSLEKMAQNFEVFGALSELWTDYGVIFRHQGERDKAEICFQRSISMNNESEYSWFNWGNLYMDEGRYAEAEQLYIRALRIDEQNIEVWVQLIYSVLARRDFLIGLRFIEQAKRRGGEFPIFFYLQSLIFFELGNMKEAKWSIHRALQNGNRKIFWEHLILLLESEGMDTSDAIKFLNESS